jgi:hypothetical protein
MDSRLWNLQALCALIVICESCSFFSLNKCIHIVIHGMCVCVCVCIVQFFCQCIGISSSSLYFVVIVECNIVNVVNFIEVQIESVLDLDASSSKLITPRPKSYNIREKCEHKDSKHIQHK